MKTEDNRKRYKCVCPICGEVFWACKSIFQESYAMHEFGAASCIKCKTFLRLTYHPESNTMSTARYKPIVKKLSKKKR